MTKVIWTKRVKPGERRTPAQLDFDVGISLRGQWAHQQPNVRRNGDRALERAASIDMDWEGRLPPGPFGVRILILTLFCWGAELDQEVHHERVEWNRLAQDFVEVLNILATQAGSYQAPKASPGASQAEAQKRAKCVFISRCRRVAG